MKVTFLRFELIDKIFLLPPELCPWRTTWAGFCSKQLGSETYMTFGLMKFISIQLRHHVSRGKHMLGSLVLQIYLLVFLKRIHNRGSAIKSGMSSYSCLIWQLISVKSLWLKDLFAPGNSIEPSVQLSVQQSVDRHTSFPAITCVRIDWFSSHFMLRMILSMPRVE